MTAIEKVDYDEATNPVTFKLIFSTYIMTLQAETKEEARDWVQKINEGNVCEVARFKLPKMIIIMIIMVI